jgi:DNA polymerase III epsilon subunit-like protein
MQSVERKYVVIGIRGSHAMHNLLFCDTETTGALGEDRLCQVAFKFNDIEQHEGLFKPPLPIKIVAMAVTHITNEMVEDKPAFQGSFIHTRITELLNGGAVLVAHNAEFDLRMLKYENVVPCAPHICTLKLARHIDKGGKYENHQLQYLRYFYGLKIEADAHSAMGDVLVLEAVFYELMEELLKMEGINMDEAVIRAIEISKLPSEFRLFNFGKYNGKTIAEVARYDRPYIEWLLNAKLAKPENEEAWIYTLTKALQ